MPTSITYVPSLWILCIVHFFSGLNIIERPLQMGVLKMIEWNWLFISCFIRILREKWHFKKIRTHHLQILKNTTPSYYCFCSPISPWTKSKDIYTRIQCILVKLVFPFNFVTLGAKESTFHQTQSLYLKFICKVIWVILAVYFYDAIMGNDLPLELYHCH